MDANAIIPLAKLARAHFTFPDESLQTIYDSSGLPLRQEISNHLHKRIWGYARMAMEYSADPDHYISPERSVFDFCVARISEDDSLDEDTKRLALQLLDFLTTFTAVDVRKQSLRHYKAEAELPVCSSVTN